MPLKLETVGKSDLHEIAKLDQVAMKDMGISQAIWKIQEEEGIDRTEAFVSFSSIGMGEDGQHFYKVVDTDTDEMISVAKFRIQPKSKKEKSKQETSGSTPPPNAKLSELFAWLNTVPNEFAEANFAGLPHARMWNCNVFTE